MALKRTKHITFLYKIQTFGNIASNWLFFNSFVEFHFLTFFEKHKMEEIFFSKKVLFLFF